MKVDYVTKSCVSGQRVREVTWVDLNVLEVETRLIVSVWFGFGLLYSSQWQRRMAHARFPLQA
jgi:hypothetical protein